MSRAPWNNISGGSPRPEWWLTFTGQAAQSAPDYSPEDEEPFEMYPDDETEIFECKSCGESFRTSRKGCDKIYCYYCGKEIPSAANKSQNAMKAKGSKSSKSSKSSNGKKAKGK